MHILIIEDEEQLCRSMAEGLRMDGYEIDEEVATDIHNAPDPEPLSSFRLLIYEFPFYASS